MDGGLKGQPLTFSAKDFEFLGLAGWTQDNLLAAFGVPAGKLGLVKDVNRANAEGIDLTFNAECVKPRLDLIEDVLAFGLLPRYARTSPWPTTTRCPRTAPRATRRPWTSSGRGP